MIYSKIEGTGHHLPEKIMTNFDLEELVDTSDEWIKTSTGVERRHIASPNEATSDLDADSEKYVQDALHNLMKHRTTFVIAHRLSTIKHADSIIVLDKVVIVEFGTHEKLLSSSFLYKKYYEMQIR